MTTDGKWLLVRDPQSQAFLMPLEGRGPSKPLPTLTPEYQAINFSADGSWLYLVDPAERPPKVRRMSTSTGRLEVWREIPITDPATVITLSNIRITPDGKSLAYASVGGSSELYVIHGLR